MKVLARVPPGPDSLPDDAFLTALAGTPWRVRPARGPGARPALELYEAGRLADIIVATPVAPLVVRGARRSRRDGQVFSLAWGCLPADGRAISVAFARSGPRRATARAEIIEAAGPAWFAVAEGRFTAVSVLHHGRADWLRLQTGPLW